MCFSVLLYDYVIKAIQSRVLNEGSSCATHASNIVAITAGLEIHGLLHRLRSSSGRLQVFGRSNGQ